MAKKVTLYYADWCPHCVSYKPEWESIKKVLNSKGIKTAEFEHGKHKNIIEKANVSGFPTLHYDDGNGNIEQIMDRSSDGILTKVGVSSIQSGGGGNNNQLMVNNQMMLNDMYYKKYIKYKTKYLSNMKGGSTTATLDVVENINLISSNLVGLVPSVHTWIQGFIDADKKGRTKSIKDLADSSKKLVDTFTTRTILPNLHTLMDESKKSAGNDTQHKDVVKEVVLLAKQRKVDEFRAKVTDQYLGGVFDFTAKNFTEQILTTSGILEQLNKEYGPEQARQFAPHLLANMTLSTESNVVSSTFVDWSIFQNTDVIATAGPNTQLLHVCMGLALLCCACHLVEEARESEVDELFAIAQSLYYKTLVLNSQVKSSQSTLGSKLSKEIEQANTSGLQTSLGKPLSP